MPRLIVIKGPDKDKHFDLAAAVVGVGRDAANAVKLHDTEVSRKHAEFRRGDAGGYVLVDVGSANGCLVNTKPVRQAVLQPGDHVQIGQTIMVYSDRRPEPQPAGDLAERITMVTRQDLELSSAIIKTVGEDRGSQILARPDRVTTPWLKTRLANLGVVYEAVQAVSHILDIDQMLDRVMDLVFRSIEADVGCVMLRDPETGEFRPKAVRRRDPSAESGPLAVSRTIMDHVLREKQGVLVNDAAQDLRFASQSIVKYNIHEVICVPMKGRHDTVGVLYLDTVTRARDAAAAGATAGRFTEDHLALAIAIGHQAAMAVEDTRYHQAMLQAERLAAVGQTVAALSHHIKNIMQGLQTGRELFKQGMADKDEQYVRTGWAIIEKNQLKIEELVKDMLSYSKEREPNVALIDLNRVVADVVELMRGRAAALDAGLTAELSSGLPPVPADAEAVHRSLLNIVGNALDALEDRPERRVTVTSALSDDGEWAVVAVADTGVGIAADKLADIFKPFVSTKGARGTGLGLAVSRKSVREHGGDVTVASRPGVGSTFTLKLPMVSPFLPSALDALPPDFPPTAPPAD